MTACPVPLPETTQVLYMVRAETTTADGMERIGYAQVFSSREVEDRDLLPIALHFRTHRMVRGLAEAGGLLDPDHLTWTVDQTDPRLVVPDVGGRDL